MNDNGLMHVCYTVVTLFVDNVSMFAAGVMFFLQAIILVPKAYAQLRLWFK